MIGGLDRKWLGLLIGPVYIKEFTQSKRGNASGISTRLRPNFTGSRALRRLRWVNSLMHDGSRHSVLTLREGAESVKSFFRTRGNLRKWRENQRNVGRKVTKITPRTSNTGAQRESIFSWDSGNDHRDVLQGIRSALRIRGTVRLLAGILYMYVLSRQV